MEAKALHYFKNQECRVKILRQVCLRVNSKAFKPNKQSMRIGVQWRKTPAVRLETGMEAFPPIRKSTDGLLHLMS